MAKPREVRYITYPSTLAQKVPYLSASAQKVAHPAELAQKVLYLSALALKVPYLFALAWPRTFVPKHFPNTTDLAGFHETSRLS